MKQELIKLLNNCYSEIDKFKCGCIVVAKDNRKFSGVNIKNSVYRDSIYAEVSAIVNAVSNGYKKNDLKEIHILANSDKYYICREIIGEFFNDNDNVFTYNLADDKVKKTKVKDL